MSHRAILISTLPRLYAESGGVIARRTSDGELLRLDREDVVALASIHEAGSFDKLVADLIASFGPTAAAQAQGHQWASRFLRWFGASDKVHAAAQPLAAVATASIRRLMSFGLLEDSSTFLSAVDEGEDLPCAVPAVLTCDRPHLLRRLLHALPHGYSAGARLVEGTCLIIDDSTKPESRHVSRQVIEAAFEENGARCVYFGRTERDQLCEAVSRKAGISEDILTFALRAEGPMTGEGAARNFVSLLTAGSQVLQIDDDVAKVLRSATENKWNTSVRSEPFPYSMHFAAESLSRAIVSPRALLGTDISRTVLGRHVEALLAEPSTLKKWPPVGNDDIDAMHIKNGCVRITTVGCVGDAGTYTMAGFLLSAPKASIAEACRTPADYAKAMSTREIYRYVPELTLTRSPYLQTMCFGLDNRNLVPPFFPMGRNLDGLFGAMFLRLDRTCWIGHLPDVVVHQPEPRRTDPFPYREALCRMRLNDILILCMEDCTPPATDNLSAGLSIFAEQIDGLAHQSIRSFRNYLRHLVLRRKQRLLHTIAQRRSDCVDLGKCFLDDLDHIERSINASLTDPRSESPIDLELAYGHHEALERMKLLMSRYANVLRVWPQAWEAAQSLHLLDHASDISPLISRSHVYNSASD